MVCVYTEQQHNRGFEAGGRLDLDTVVRNAELRASEGWYSMYPKQVLFLLDILVSSSVELDGHHAG